MGQLSFFDQNKAYIDTANKSSYSENIFEEMHPGRVLYSHASSHTWISNCMYGERNRGDGVGKCIFCAEFLWFHSGQIYAVLWAAVKEKFKIAPKCLAAPWAAHVKEGGCEILMQNVHEYFTSGLGKAMGKLVAKIKVNKTNNVLFLLIASTWFKSLRKQIL